MVEVKELVLRANFTENPVGASTNGNGANTNGECGDASGRVGAESNGTGGGTNNDMLEDCVRQVLAILKRQKER